MKASVVITCIIALAAGVFSAWMNATDASNHHRGNRFSSDRLHSVRDVFSLTSPSDVTLSGMFGKRCEANIVGWLLKKNEDSLLLCYTNRPGWYGYQGEHVGKWIDAATRAWANSRNSQLRAKLDRVVTALLATQLADGYLGTYVSGNHWSTGRDGHWDVWVHKYNLIGLLTYAELAGSTQALHGARRIGDLIVATFGSSPKLDLNTNAPHRGMVSGGILEPMVRLYQATHDVRYLQFAIDLVEQWENDDGPRLVSSLINGIPVSATANGKAYEMLSCLNGLCELYRATGDKKYLTPVLNAWQDIVQHQLLPTGSGSQGEFWFKDDTGCNEDCDGLGEICVTWNWLHLNTHLLRLTGSISYADEIERTVYNHLAAAQKLDGSAWSYFTNLRGKRVYSDKQTCCSSNGPRAIASLPSYVFMHANDGIVVNLFTNSKAHLVLPSGDSVEIVQRTDYPVNGRINLTVTVRHPSEFTISMRIPTWSRLLDSDSVGGQYKKFTRTWNGTSVLSFDLDIPFRVELMKPVGFNCAVALRGPEVLAIETPIDQSGLRQMNAQLPHTGKSLIENVYLNQHDQPVYSSTHNHHPDIKDDLVEKSDEIFYVPFSTAGTNGSWYSTFFLNTKLIWESL